MFVRNWGKSLFCVLLVCVVFLSLSFSFAAEDMVKSCNFFLGVGGLFMLEGVEYGTYLASLGTACGDILAGAFGSISLGIIAAISFIYMPAVGEPDGYVDNYWDYHYSPDDSYVVFPDDDLVEIKNHNLIKEYKKNSKRRRHSC